MPQQEHGWEEGLLCARIGDACRAAQMRSAPRFVGFLSPGQRQIAAASARSAVGRFAFYGGYEDAERVFFAALPDWLEEDAVDWPFQAVSLFFREQDSLTHRSVLGTLMSLGIARETVGDILIEPGRCVFFISSELSGYVLSQMEKVGGVGVNLRLGAEEPYPAAHTFLEMEGTISSPRLDCVLSALCRISRGKCGAAIETGLVFLNDTECPSPARRVMPGDRISVRGTGKFVVDDLTGRTKKGRLILKARKYI